MVMFLHFLYIYSCSVMLLLAKGVDNPVCFQI